MLSTSGAWKEWKLHLATAVASQPAAGHSFSFIIIIIVIMTLDWNRATEFVAEFSSHA